MRVETRPVPAPAPGDAVVRIAYGGVCGSDLHYWTHGAAGESVLRAPMVLGHEVVGTVLVAAADGSGPAAGTEVAVHPAGTTDPAAPFPPGRPNLSPAGTYLGSAARFPHTEGAFARHAVLPASTLRPLPPGLSLRTAAVAEPAAVAWHAVARAGDVAGKRALVVGCGPIGLLVVAVLRRAGAAEIVVSDVHERPMAVARELGATRGVVATDPDGIAAVAADVVFESSGSPRGLASAVRGAARAGTVVMVGLLPSGEQPALLSLAITRELDLRGSFRFAGEMDDVLAALADGSLRADAVVSHVVGVDDALAAFELALDATASSKVLLEF
nr:zinc-binding dehydrogenase [Kineococcus siccus]